MSQEANFGALMATLTSAEHDKCNPRVEIVTVGRSLAVHRQHCVALGGGFVVFGVVFTRYCDHFDVRRINFDALLPALTRGEHVFHCFRGESVALGHKLVVHSQSCVAFSGTFVVFGVDFACHCDDFDVTRSDFGPLLPAVDECRARLSLLAQG